MFSTRAHRLRAAGKDSHETCGHFDQLHADQPYGGDQPDVVRYHAPFYAAPRGPAT